MKMKKETMLDKGYTAWLKAMLDIAKHYRLDYSEEHVKATIAWEMGSPADVVLDEMAKSSGWDA